MKRFKVLAKEGVFVRTGRLIKISGQAFGLHKETQEFYWGTYGNWVITHLPTGCIFAHEFSYKEAVKLAKSRLLMLDAKLKEMEKIIDERMKEHGVKYPLNK